VYLGIASSAVSAAVSNEDNDTPTLVGFGVRAGLIAAAAGSVVGQGAGVGARYL